MVKFSTFKLSS